MATTKAWIAQGCVACGTKGRRRCGRHRRPRVAPLNAGEEGRGDMARQQLDFFSTSASPSESCSSSNAVNQPVKPPSSLEDAEIVAQIPKAGVVEAPLLATEAGHRRLTGAISALESLCQRFAGFGLNRRIPEQEAALDALVMIGGRDARKSVTKMILKGAVQGPSLGTAVAYTMAKQEALSSDAGWAGRKQVRLLERRKGADPVIRRLPSCLRCRAAEGSGCRAYR